MILPSSKAKCGASGIIFLPQSISWFTNIPIHSNGQFDWAPSPSKAGDFVTLKAEMDCDVIVCSCCQDIVEINCRNPTPLTLELLGDAV